MKDYKDQFPGEWESLLTDNEKLLQEIHDRLNFEVVVESKTVYPSSHVLYRAFKECPLEEVKVVILGQDPYHDGSATGLCFDNIIFKDKMSPSLSNIKKEMLNEGITVNEMAAPEYCMLTHLPRQGVLLINTALTVEKGKPNSHKEIWKPFTDKVIEKLNTKDNIVWVLWGANALSYKDKITNETHRFIISSHPSPLSCKNTLGKYPAFEGSKPFSKTNLYLEEMGKPPIQW